MNNDIIAGTWKQFKGSLRSQWGKLTDDEVEMAKGSRENLEGAIQKKYGQTKEEVSKAIDELCTKCDFKFEASTTQPENKEAR